MDLNSSVTELTTAGTDALLGFLCILLAFRMGRCMDPHRFKARIWQWVFGLLAASSLLGSIAHGLHLSPGLRNLLWQPLYLALGLDVALFVVGSVLDGFGEKYARRLTPVALLAGTVFYSITLFGSGSFLVFTVYEGTAMLFSLGVYIRIALTKGMPGAATISSGIGLTIVAAALQAGSLGLSFIWPFDHNGIFHLVQIPALILLACGLQSSIVNRQS